MKGIMLGALAGAALVWLTIAAVEPDNEVFAQRVVPQQPTGSSNGLIAVSAPAANGGQLITVIDPNHRAMGVYRVDAATGKLALCSVRNIHWDLQMMYLNNEPPLPQEIRSLLEPR